MIRAALACLAVLWAAPARADLTLPDAAVLAVSTSEGPASHRVAIGPYRSTLPATVAEGTVTRRVWRVPGAETSLALLAPLRAQLLADGWEVVFECAVRDCGGFDFRFEIDVTPAPEMFVDLADYRYLSARRGDAWTTLVVSLSAGTGYVQSIRVEPQDGLAKDGATPDGSVQPVKRPDGTAAPTPGDTVAPVPGDTVAPVPGDTSPTPPDPATATAPGTAPVPDTGLARALRETGHAVLPDLDFASGGTDLAADAYASLDALAAYMKADPAVTVALVGHTDATGGAAGNLAISRRRAESARRLLVSRHGIAAGRVDVHGVGFYAPVASNATEEGRRANRRVEVVVTSTD